MLLSKLYHDITLNAPEHRINWFLNAQKEGRVDWQRSDGLTFLLRQPDNSGNVLCSSIDTQLISDMNYLKRLAQEAFRVVPIGSCLITCNSDFIKKIAG